VLVPSSDLQCSSREQLMSWWNEVWATCPVASHYRNIQPSIPSFPWFSSQYFPRHLIASLIRLRLDHSRLPASLFRRHLVPSPECSCTDHPPADLNHILFSCPNTSSMRSPFFSSLSALNFPAPYHSSFLLLSDNLSAFPLIYSFLTSCNIPV
jgi:hypothetical protein